MREGGVGHEGKKRRRRAKSRKHRTKLNVKKGEVEQRGVKRGTKVGCEETER